MGRLADGTTWFIHVLVKAVFGNSYNRLSMVMRGDASSRQTVEFYGFSIEAYQQRFLSIFITIHYTHPSQLEFAHEMPT